MNLYDALIKFANGELNENPFKVDNDDRFRIQFRRYNKENPGTSIVLLSFYRKKDFIDLFVPDDEYYNNSYLIDRAYENYGYSGLVFLDGYSADDEFAEGYVLRTISDENKEKLKEILRTVHYKLYQDLLEDNYESVSKFLIDKYENIFSDAAYEYQSLHDDCLVKGMRGYIDDKFCGILPKEFKIMELKCGFNYVTTLENIIKIYKKYDYLDKNLYDLLKLAIHDENLTLDDDLYDDFYAYYDDSNFDDESWQYYLSKSIDKLSDKVEDEIDSGVLDEHKKIYELLEKLNLKIGVWYSFPTEKKFGEEYNKIYRIDGIDNGKLTLITKIKGSYLNSNDTQTMNIEDFINFLYHPELFD